MPSALVLLISLLVVTLGAEMLVRGASLLALRVGVSPLIVGLTIVGFVITSYSIHYTKLYEMSIIDTRLTPAILLPRLWLRSMRLTRRDEIMVISSGWCPPPGWCPAERRL